MFPDLSLPSIFGVIGVGLYMTAYASLQSGLLQGRTYAYSLLNLSAASCVLMSLIEHFNLSAAIIQTFWITVSIIGIARIYLINNAIRFDHMELEFLKTKLPSIANDQAKKLFAMGSWHNGRTGESLIEEGQQVKGLYYIARGRGHITSQSKEIAGCENGDYVGEITCFSGHPATSTVCFSEPSIYFVIPVDKIRTLMRKNNALFTELEKSIAEDLRGKLSRSNAYSAGQDIVKPNVEIMPASAVSTVNPDRPLKIAAIES